METTIPLADLLRWGGLLGLSVVGSAALWSGLRAYFRFSGKRIVSCPEYTGPAAVEVDATHAALTAAISRPDLRLARCSRWPERQHCGQVCLDQIEAAPEGTLVSTIVSKWYRDKKCVYCGKPFAEIRSGGGAIDPTLVESDGRSVELRELPTEEIPGSLAGRDYVCWNCHIVERLRKERVERPAQELPRLHDARETMH